MKFVEVIKRNTCWWIGSKEENGRTLKKFCNLYL